MVPMRVRHEGRATADSGGRHGHRVFANPGGAAPARSGEAEFAAIRRGAGMGLRRTAATGAAQQTGSAAPIWLAALNAASCQVTRRGEDSAVPWSCAAGRAVYTNSGADTETIRPLGVNLECGQTLAVYWMPGETGYSMEVYGRNDVCARRAEGGGRA
jgi:hypothetical protein